MELRQATLDRARRSRDARFDGRFFIAITSTRIYCRPICPSPRANAEHVRYYPSAAAAEAEGFRPCLRCRPEAAPGTPAWSGTSALVSRALRLIGEGALDDDGVELLADRLGVTARHVRRLFLQHLGATPCEVAQTRRIHFAKQLLDETTLGFQQVAFAAGFGSVRRFNSEIRRTYARTPTELRRLARRADTDPGCYRFRLAYRPPYDWEAVLAMLCRDAIPGVEVIAGGHYRRTIAIDDDHGSIDVSHVADRAVLEASIRFPRPTALLAIVERVRRMFDVSAAPAVIHDQLRADPLLRGPLARAPGVRSPCAWDGHEFAVRAILGRSPRATVTAGRIASTFGAPVPERDGLRWVFPRPAQLALAPLERIGVTRSRADAIRTLSRHVAAGTISLAACVDDRATVEALRTIRGIDRTLAESIAMRALGEPDAFPSTDPVLRRAANVRTARELELRSQAWRPWRAYAAMVLWQEAADEGEGTIAGARR